MITDMDKADDGLRDMLSSIASEGINCFADCDDDTKKSLTYLYMSSHYGDDAMADPELTGDVVKIFSSSTPDQYAKARIDMCNKIEKMASSATEGYVDDRLPGLVADNNRDAKRPDLHKALEDIGRSPMMLRALGKFGVK